MYRATCILDAMIAICSAEDRNTTIQHGFRRYSTYVGL